MTEGEERKVTVAKARRSSPSVDRNVRGDNVHSLASQQRPANIECTELAIQPQLIRRSNQPASNPMRDRDGSAHADSRHSRPQQFDSIRQAAGATNGTRHPVAASDVSKSHSTRSATWVHVIVTSWFWSGLASGKTRGSHYLFDYD
jgi:hypothetical protein